MQNKISKKVAQGDRTERRGQGENRSACAFHVRKKERQREKDVKTNQHYSDMQ